MAKLKTFSLLVIISFFITSLQVQLSRQDAIHLVLGQVLQADIGNINVFASLKVHSGDEALQLLYYDPIPYPYEFNWAFFVDDSPHALWDHPCRYIFVDSLTGDYSIVGDRPIYPLRFQEFELVSSVPGSSPCTPVYTQPLTQTINGLSSSPHLYAVIIGGSEDDTANIFST